MTLLPADLESDDLFPRTPRTQSFAGEPVSRGRARKVRWEPGFLDLSNGRPARRLSYAVDALGVHYDATAPSELERRLQGGGWETADLLARAEAAIDRLARLRSGPETPQPQSGHVLVIDQARSDPAVGFGLAGAARFTAMLAAAISENAGAEVRVLSAPSGSGFITDRPPQVAAVASDPLDPWAPLRGASRVYTVSSVLGVEALLAQAPVTCFGAPFYAGWGLTDDRLSLHRRGRRRSVAEVFAAAYILGSRYFDPFTGAPAELEQALDILELVQERHRENAVATLAVGFAAWKRDWVQATLGSSASQPRIAPARPLNARDLEGVDRVVAWSSREPAGLQEVCEAAGAPLLRMEDGFLRSVGLGVGLRPGASYVLDGRRPCYDASAPSDLEVLLQETAFDEVLIARAGRLRRKIVEARLSKYNVGASDLPRLPTDREVVLVAGQVENDASLRLGGATVQGNAGLLTKVREAHPDAFIAYKPHPDVEAGLRPGRIHARRLRQLCDAVLRDCAAPVAIAAADRVEVATSLLGFEALMRGKPVTTHGLPFYAGWGLTSDPGCARRTRRLQLDELVAAALILYPRYLDPITGLPCTPEVLVQRLAERSPKLSSRRMTLEGVGKAIWSLGYRASAAGR